MEERALSFDSLPTEALFNFFWSFNSNDLSLLANYSTVCKKWDQMCRDNELWRRYCHERWDKNPKESDCAKKWLIPVREGVGSKENRINWKKYYEIRSLHEQAINFLSPVVPEKIKRLGKQKTNTAKAQSNPTDLFAKGWPTIEEVVKFGKYICGELVRESEIEQEGNSDAPEPDYIAVLSFFVEMELCVLRNLNVSRSKHLGITSRVIMDIFKTFRDEPMEASKRLAKYASQYAQLAKEKDAPTSMVEEFFEQASSIFTDIIGNVSANDVKPIFYEHLMHFTSTVIATMSHVLQDGLEVWANEEVDDDEGPLSPTFVLEMSLRCISEAFQNKPHVGMPLFCQAINRGLGSLQSPKHILTMLNVMGCVSECCGEFIIDNLETFMTTYILPYWKFSQNAEYLVPLLYFTANVYREVPGQRIQTEYVAQIIPPLLEMAKHDNLSVKREVTKFVIAYCKTSQDLAEALAPYMSDLLEVMYGYINNCPNEFIRCNAIAAISALVVKCKVSFGQHKDRLMVEFKKLLVDKEKERNAAIEALGLIAADGGSHASSLAINIEVLYDQIVEDCKKDRTTHLEMLLKMTQFSVIVLGPKFSKYLEYVFPLVLEHARSITTTERTDMDLDILDVSVFRLPRVFSEELVTRKKLALRVLENMITHFDRETFFALQNEIESALQATLTIDQENYDDSEIMLMTWDIYVKFVEKLFVKGEAWVTTQRMSSCWHICFNLASDNTVEIPLKIHSIKSMCSILKHLCSVSTPDQPFLTKQVMEFNKEIFSNLYDLCEEDEISCDEAFDFGDEIVHFVEEICACKLDKDIFWSFGDHVLNSCANDFRDNDLHEYRWQQLCLISTIFDYYGDDFVGPPREECLDAIPASMAFDAEEIYRCIANHIGVMARKYPKMVTNIDYLYEMCIEPLLVGDKCQRETGPGAYDTALMALSSLLLLVVKDDGSVNDLSRFKKFMKTLTRALPPASKGDKEEAELCIKQYCQILQMTQKLLESGAEAELKEDVIRALTETMWMKEYNTPEVHGVVDPVLQKLQSE